jgi:Concanavalin A-like lectin/glucanases superfamily
MRSYVGRRTKTRGFRPRRALVAAALVCFVPLCSAGLDDGLMAYWKFDGNALDSSGNGNHGIIRGGATPTADHNGNEGMAYQFDGINGYIGVPDSPTLHSLNQRTISMWFRFDGANVLNMPMLHQGSHTQRPDGCEATRELSVQFYPSNHAVQTISAGDGGCQRLLAGLAPMDRGWHQMTTVIDRLVLHKMQTYIDGELAASIPDDYRSFNRSSEELRLAWTVEESRYRPFHGALDEVRIYERALSKAEVRELFLATLPVSGVTLGLTQFAVTCTNHTTGQIIGIPKSRARWDCESAGLLVAPEDDISVETRGSAR